MAAILYFRFVQEDEMRASLKKPEVAVVRRRNQIDKGIPIRVSVRCKIGFGNYNTFGHPMTALSGMEIC